MIVSQEDSNAISRNAKSTRKISASAHNVAEHLEPKLQRYIAALTPFVPDASLERIAHLGRIIDCYRLYQVRHINNPDAIAYTEFRLRDELGRNWKEWAGHILFTDGGYRFSKTKSYTKELTVRPDVVEAIKRECRKPRNRFTAANIDNRKKVALRHGRKGVKYRVKTNLPPSVSIDVYNAQALETIYTNWLDAIEDGVMPDLSADAYMDLYNDIRGRSVHTDKTFDEFAPVWYRAVSLRREEAVGVLEKLQGDQLPQQYEQRRNKPRYQQIGIGLQNCHKALRYGALAGQWSYDIKACHHFIMQHYARLGGIECPVLDSLVQDKKKFRSLLSLQTDLTVECIKTALLIKSYGGRFGWADVYDDDRDNALKELLGVDGQKVLADNELFKKLSRETHQITTYIIEHHKPTHGAQGGVLNAMGQLLRSTRGNTLKRSQIAAFILQGLEAKAALAMIDESRTAAVLIHDGIVCVEQEDIPALERAMFDTTSIRFKLDCEQIKAPDWL